MSDLYNNFVHKSRYARYLDDKKRRESWSETVARYFDFMEDHLRKNYSFELGKTRKDLETAVLKMEIMPSMRAIMTAGKALERDSTCSYNCSFVAVDDPKAFDEAMHILLCGTGVGFSVERQYINELPEIPDKLFESDTTIIVRDSKEGWAKAFRQVIALLYSGEIPKWDMSKVRPAGSRLKVFGGRSSGPRPLDDLFRFTVNLFKNAAGRKLTSLECHDLMCKVAEIVVVGGVRRAALISFSNLSDDRMRHAKSGAWWEQNGQRALSNNSAVYTERPDVGAFMNEWLALYESKSGERGIFNEEAIVNHVKKNGRRKANFPFRSNPCNEIILRPNGLCNLSEVIVRSTDSIADLKRKIRLATILGTIQSTFTNFPYLRKQWQKNAEEERLLGVSLTGILDNALINNADDPKLPEILEGLKAAAVETNKEWADKFGINQSAAITCVKPSGTVSALTGTASGIHPRHSKYYYRRVRSDIKDPLTKFMIDAGIPAEPDVMNPDNIMVFTFPQKAPDGAITRDQLSAIDHLKLWLVYQRHYCEHKPSITISVKENDWPTVGAWVWENFDEMTGVAFLPFDGGIYRQAPFEECTKEAYEDLLSIMPKNVDWDSLVEVDDTTEGVQALACSAGGCEL